MLESKRNISYPRTDELMYRRCYPPSATIAVNIVIAIITSEFGARPRMRQRCERALHLCFSDSRETSTRVIRHITTHCNTLQHTATHRLHRNLAAFAASVKTVESRTWKQKLFCKYLSARHKRFRVDSRSLRLRKIAGC